MANQEIIKKNYRDAVAGIMEEWLISKHTKWYEYITRLSNKLQTTYLIVVLDNQIFNGGFQQYYVNGYGQFTTETIRALIAIGANRKATLLEKAYKLVNKDNDSDVVFRKRILNKEISTLFNDDVLFKSLDDLDDQYYDDEKENIEELLGGYLKAY
ncbi:uncharacterized protein DUF4375 [Chitinophaga niastensis]|uniref:Uncharacterized protein DUF4375 n=1 Tax=Chitinophaga niastensis TaxID=536980 RepID=A0A2P8H9D4_CHINA|nr:DUF4375 domain-containing protein [Chitinophaga niastensis]PSL42846.1 uncharacterized protein DUF4375 [Chitinophaga niastensis]